MSIYIQGMEIPKKEGRIYHIRICSDGKVLGYYGNIIGQAIELPPHGRLVDADAIIEDIRYEILERQLNGMKGTPFYIEDLRTMWQRLEDEDISPTIIPSEGGADG